ncbi:MAG: hypothetical protein ABW043_16700 [Devosia sp.]|uniref:hypothetical protein n=1 Tax=Devosia sp. TaxID=1871048 RepID=UPI0033965C07
MPVRGLEANIARLKGISADIVGPEIGKALFVTAQSIQVDAQISLTTGAVSGKGHVPSAPGTPPNNDTGTLADSIQAQEVGPFKAQVIADAPYAAIQEFGGNTGTAQLPERPYMRPAALKNKDTLKANVQGAVNRILAKNKK